MLLRNRDSWALLRSNSLGWVMKPEVLQSATSSFSVAIPNLPWAESHGVSPETGDVGLTLLYVGVSHAIGAQTILVIGSGSGFIPTLFSVNTKALVVLIDAVLPDPGGGSPSDAPGDFYRLDEFQRVSARENLIIIRGLSETFLKLCIRYGISFDLIFVDGDHSTHGFTSDLTLAFSVVRQHQGAIICHDANQSNINEVLNATKAKYLRFQTAVGCAVLITEDSAQTGIPSNHQSVRDTIILRQAEIEEAMIQSDGERWDYLTDSLFENRMQRYFELLLMSGLQLRNDAEILEIGGNPSPLIQEFVKFSEVHDLNFRLISVEPLISQVASSKYELLRNKGLRIVPRIDDLVEETSPNVILLCGFDLSLASTYEELVAEFMRIRNLVRGADLIFVEFPDYEPSRRLFELLSLELEIVNSRKFTFGSEVPSRISLTTQFTSRNAFVCKPAQSISDFDPTTTLTYYAKIHGITGTPLPDWTVAQWSGDHEAIFRVFDSFPIEQNPVNGQQFVWLRKIQHLRFPRFAYKLEFDLAWEVAGFEFSQSDLEVQCDGRFLRIKRRLRAAWYVSDYLLELPSFVPSEVEAMSTDSRQLTVPVRKFRFV